jgi:ABC-type uncharacterized transport system substrate-binding protein
VSAPPARGTATATGFCNCGPLAFVAVLLIWLLPTVVSAQVLAVLSDESPGYQAVVEELRSGLHGLRDGELQVDTVTAAHLADIDAVKLSHYDLVVSIGLAAAQTVTLRDAAASLPPTLCLLIPRQSFEKLPVPRGNAGERRLTALFIDQPLSRQLDLLRLALPDSHRIGVILGPGSAALAEELRAGAKARSLDIAFATVGERAALYPALQALLPQSELLLLLPDPVAINADTVYGLLLASYRARVPVAGFSEGLLKAGSLFALFSTPRQQGVQGAEIARRLLAHEGGLPAPQYPRDFTVRVNASVARSLGLHVPAEQDLQTALGAHRSEGDATHDAGAATRGEQP